MSEGPLWEGYPLHIENYVWFCGFISKKTFSAKTYLIVRQNGNVLVDCAAPDPALLDAIKKLGGVKHLFITHCDHAQHHEEWHKHTGCDRWIHSLDVKKKTQWNI